MGKTTLIIGVFALFLATTFAADAVTTTCPHTCNSDNTFELGSVQFKCSDKYACVNVPPKCTPCILETLKCADKFKCPPLRPAEVIIGGLQLKCPDDSLCNIKGEGNCKPCIYKACSGVKNFECRNETAVIYMGMDLNCANDSMCNINYEPPCTPCIKAAAAA